MITPAQQFAHDFLAQHRYNSAKAIELAVALLVEINYHAEASAVTLTAYGESNMSADALKQAADDADVDFSEPDDPAEVAEALGIDADDYDPTGTVAQYRASERRACGLF